MPHQRDVSWQMKRTSKDISNVTIIGIGVVLFIIIIAIWYLFLK